MALQTFPERFTHTPLFREYPWLSDAFLSGRWLEAATHGGGFKDYAEFLVQLDQRVPPANSTEYSDAEGRALLGLDNAYKVVRAQVAANSKAVSKTWTTLLRFQVLDVLLAMKWGISDMPCAVYPAPTGIKQLELLTSLTAKESKRKAQAPSDDQDVVATAPGSTADSEAWTLVQRLSGLNPKSLLQKTIKNLQAMGTALTWIIESRVCRRFVPLTIRVNDLYQSTHDAAAQVGTLTVVELLRPLSYALNSSFMTVFCDLDLQKEFGNVMNQYETKLFLGRYRTPRLAFMEDVVLTVVRDIAIGTPVDASVATFLAADSEHLTRLPPAETADQSIFVPSDAENLRLAVTSSRKRTKHPTTAVDHSAASLRPDWSALLTFDDSGDTPGNEGCVLNVLRAQAPTLELDPLASLSAEETSVHISRTRLPIVPCPAGASSKALYIRPREHESAEVPDSQIDVDRENPSVTEDTSPAFNAKETGRVACSKCPGNLFGDESGSKYAEHADSDEQVGSSGVARVPDGMGLSNTHEENMDNNNGSFASSDQPSPHPEPDQAAPRIFSPITPDIRAPDGEIADVVDSKVDAERENRSVPEDSSPVPQRHGGNIEKKTPVEFGARYGRAGGKRLPGLRLPPKDGVTLSTDYSDINRRTTLRRFFAHAKRDDGLVLNALQLPSSHFPHANPLAGSHTRFAAALTSKRSLIDRRRVFLLRSADAAQRKKWFDIAGTKWTMTLPHLDAAGGTIVGSQGAGEKYWITKRDDTESIHDSQTYRTWNPDEPDFESGRAFWLDLTSVRPAEDTVLFAPYLPTLDEHSTKGWMDIVCIACLVVLSVCFDRRGYLDFIPQEELLQREHDSIPQEELLQREQVISMYRRWRRWFTVKYVGRKGDAVVDWEADVFTPALLHLARVLLCYHEEERSDSANSESDGLVRFSGEVVKSKVVDALESYSSGLGAQLSTPPQHSRFWLFSGDEFTLHALF
ncbi:hypothetical protein B0H14DRAFT_3516087 [Mycena olivaceomarginata]|nr:hypothetical protein B0H14DRAFT_3516087 [Mycena olivaceomarginata]